MATLFDVIVRGGRILDGGGAPPYPGDVGVRAGRIAALGSLDAAAAGTVIDATGRLVAPGFIDAHSHADAAVISPEVQLAVLRQGVTTLVCGQDGLSFAPATPAALGYVRRYFAAINGDAPVSGEGPLGVADLMAIWRGRCAVNTAYLVPHGTVRFSVVGGAERAPDDGELAAMTRLVEQGLGDGAVGLSSGLEYLPGRYAGVAELVRLCRPVAAAGLPYVTHMRGYGVAAPLGLAEARAISAASGVALHVSHLHGPAPTVLPLLADGITFDSYPYRRGCTILAMAALPRRYDDTDLDRAAGELSDPATRAEVLAALTERPESAALWPRITFAHVPHPQWRWVEGRTLTDAAESAGLAPAEVLLDVLIATRLAASGVIEAPPTTTDESIRALLRHPSHLGGSDGIFIGAHPHPRAWGAFARFLRRHVRELADWSWPQAVEHLASRPAERFGLTDRGRLLPGLAADLVVFDPATVADRADYARPRELAVGVDDVIVNGVPVLAGGQLTGALAGQPLRPYPGG